MKKFICTICFIALTILSANAQTSDLTDEQKEVLSSRIIDKLEDFQYFLQTMADRRNSVKVRTDAKLSNINLFIGKCEDYDEYDDWYGVPINHDAVRMQTSSTRTNEPKSQPMKDYLTKIYNGLGYSNIRIEQSDAIRVDNFRKVGENKYMAVAHIHQTFIGYGRGEKSIRYADETGKKVIIHIDVVELPSEDGVENELLYDIKLGDMLVEYTSKIR